MTNVMLVIDMLNDFCAKGGKFFDPNCKAIIPAVKHLVTKRYKELWTIIRIEDEHSKNDLEIRLLGEHCLKTSSGNKLVEELDLLKTNLLVPVIAKQTFDGFLGKSLGWSNDTLEIILNRLEPKIIEVVGVCTNGCVFHTVSTLAGLRAAGRFNFDFDIVIYKDCVATSDKAEGDHALNHLKKWFGVKIIDEAPK